MENHSVFALFMIPKNQMPNEVVKKYPKFWWFEKLKKLHWLFTFYLVLMTRVVIF
jgi:hypothetical protein